MKRATTKSHRRKVVKTLLIILAVPVGIVLTIIIAAYIFVSFQKPRFVNKDLNLHNRLNIPQVLTPRMENGEKVFDLTARQGKTEFLHGKHTKTLGYNGSYLGPTIRVHKGDKIRLNVTNALPDSTTAHWHGMELPAAMDGASHQLLKPGENWQPHWTISNNAASLWYHPHLMGKTGAQVYKGLAGMFIVDDDNADTLNLPKTYGVDDIPLIVQDRKFDANGQLIYDGHHKDILGHSGMHGDHILVNGTHAPYSDVPAKKIRLRVLNGSNARRYNFGFEDGRTFYQIASDGGLLPSPVARTRMLLAPAERAEIVVDLAKDTKPLTFISDAVHEENVVLRFMRTLLGAERDENQKFKILELRPQATAEVSKPLPQKLSTVEAIKVQESAITRTFTLDPGSQTINGKEMDHTRVDHIGRTGDTEIWEINNLSGVFHPFHIHGVQFQIVTRNGKPPEAHERGWKDTVLVPNAQSVRVIMRMPLQANPHLPYMFHCHILEHEDMGMMGQFMVVDTYTKPEDIFVQSKLTESSEHGGAHTH